MSSLRLDAFDFELPSERIALRPAEPRDASRLLRVRPEAAGNRFDEHLFRDLPHLLAPGDALVFNDTRVLPAALTGCRERAGAVAQISLNLHQRVSPNRWKAFAKPAKKLLIGDEIIFAEELSALVVAKGQGGEIDLEFSQTGAALDAAIEARGAMPLPPYIAKRRPADARDSTDYQTIYARQQGAVAAPTAGLHFTEAVFSALKARGISRHFITLHVGAGTFLPVKSERIEQHKMHSEWGMITAATAAELNAVRARGGRIVAVGTTSLRLLESAANDDGEIAAFSGDTDIFITPGYHFKAVDLLLTNFHLPRSTLFMLVAAFSGLEVMQAAYAHAIKRGFRFYSYGDACLLHRKGAQS